MAHSFKKQASVAYGFSLTRLSLNAYMFFEELPLTYRDEQEKRKKLDAVFMDLVSGMQKDELSLEAVDAFRNQLNREMGAVVAYSDSFRIYEYALNRVERRFVQDLPAPDLTEEELISRVAGFISSVKDAAVMNQRIQSVIGQLPVRFTRQKYYSMVHDGLSVFIGADRMSLENVMYMLRTSGMAELSDEQRKAYPELDALLKRFSAMSFKELTAETFRDAQEKIEMVGTQLFELTDYLQMMEEMVNDLYVICLTKADAMRNASEEAHACGILKLICSLYENGSREIPESAEDDLWELEGVQENYYEKYQRMEPAPEYRDGEDETVKKSRYVERLLSTSPFAPLEEPDQQSSSPVERKDVDAAFDGFVSVMDPILASSQKPVARAIMATTLSNLPNSFRSLDEVTDYVKNSLGSCTDHAEKETCIELLQQLMESEDYALV